MTIEIDRSTTKFHYGFTSLEQVELWLSAKKDIKATAFIGRSNVGKSSLINALFGTKTARTSKTPGRTREINVFSFRLSEKGNPAVAEQEYILFDLPGYGHADVSKSMSIHWTKLMELFFARVSKHTLMVTIQDARHPMQKADLKFLGYLQKFSFARLCLLNKIDKLKKQKDRAKLDKEIKSILNEHNYIKKFYKVSAESKQGIDIIEQNIINFLTK